MSAFFADLRFALRAWARKPGAPCSAVLMLALGIGAVTTVFAMAYVELWQPIPVRDPDQLESIEMRVGQMRGALLPDQYLALAGAPGLAGVAATQWQDPIALDPGASPTVTVAQVTPNMLTLLGLQPALGRNFLTSEAAPGHDGVAMIGYGLWQSRYGGARDVLGRSLSLQGRVYTIIGVLPEALNVAEHVEVGVWTPLYISLATSNPNATLGKLITLTRLRSGVSPQQADQLFTVISARLHLTSRGQPVSFMAYNWAAERSQDPGRPLLLALLAAVAMLLLIACANVAALLLSRGLARRHELAVRHALGATRSRIVRQLLTEAALLAATAAGLGVLFAFFALPLLQASPLGYTLSELSFARLDAAVLVVAVLTAAATVFVAALLPALKASRLAHGGPAAVAGGEGRSWLRSGFLVAEVALSVVLLTGAGLIGRSLFRLAAMPTGLDEAHLGAIEFTLTNAQGAQPAAGNRALALADRLRGRLGWHRFAMTDTAPFDSGYFRVFAFGVGQPLQESEQRVIGPGYFATVGQQITLGRDFTAADTSAAPGVAIVNEEWVRHFATGHSPLGMALYYSDHAPGAKPGAPTPHTIVGVASDARDYSAEFDVNPEIYLSLRQSSLGWLALVYNAQDPAALLAPARHLLAQAAPGLPISAAKTAAGFAGSDLALERFQAASFATFAGFGLLFALAGVWALVAFSVQQRQREFGIRLALGAGVRQILAQALRRTLALTLLGAAVGVAGALAASRLIASMLYQLRPTDPATYAAVVITFVAIAALAAWLPARRALNADPAATLRAE